MAKAGETQDRCTQYALDVVSGKITAGEYVRLACQRHLDDIEKSKAAPYKYYFDVEKSEEIINFAEELTIAEGEENEHVTAYPFQCFILGSLNGWRTKEKSYRRFRTSYVQLGRQNGKSFINGILACYYGNFDGYKYGKIFCTATKQDQANIVFDEVAKFINSDEDLSEWFKVHDHNHTIDCLLTHSEIKALSGDTKSLDGHRAYLGIVDEYHAHKTNQMYKLLEGGIKKLKSALISVITTAGFDLKSPCYKLYEYCCNLLKGVFENDSQFVYIAQMDEHDDRYVPENWIKANPILEFDRDALENLIPIAHTARDMGGEDLRDFLVKQLNMWMQWSNSLYIKDIAKWKACAVLKSLKNFRGSKCYVGVDLSSGGDLTSIAIVIPFMIDGIKKYFVHTHSFIPSSRVDEHIKTDKVPYDVWIEKGLVTVTETLGGIKTDYKYIIKYLEDLVKEYDLKPQLICYDPHNASAFLSDIEALGFDSISVTQTAKELNDATVDFRLEILAGNVEIEGMEVGKEGNKIVVPVDSLLVWSIANAKTISNNYGEIKIDKDITTERIDPIDAMNNLYESGLTAKATLEYTGELNEKAKTALVKSFEEFGSGAKNTGKILPVPLGMKLTPLDIKLTDSQFFELKKYNALQIAGAFGVKPNQINDYSKSSYSNSEMQQYEGTEVELEVNALAPQDRQILFGQLYENGFLIKTADDKAPEVAVGWRERKLNGKYDFKWLYAGKFAEGISEEASTKEGKLSPTTKSIKGSFYERSLDNAYEISVDESNLVKENTKAADAIKSWFSKVQEKNDAAHLNLPHISVSGGVAPFGIGGKGSLPSFSIQWYKSGGIMTNPTVFGINGNSLMVGGEAGDEAILPLAEFYNKLNNILDKKLDAVQKSNIVYVTNHTYIDGDEVASRTVSRVDAQMVTDKRKGR